MGIFICLRNKEMAYVSCGPGELFCHMFLIFVIGVYIGYSIDYPNHATMQAIEKDSRDDSQEYLQLAKDFNKTASQISAYQQLFQNFQTKSSDQSCVIIPDKTLNEHISTGEPITYNFDREFPYRPKVVVSLTGFSLKPMGSSNKVISVELQEVKKENTFPDKFLLSIVTNPAKYANIEEVSFCFYAYLNCDELVEAMNIND